MKSPALLLLLALALPHLAMAQAPPPAPAAVDDPVAATEAYLARVSPDQREASTASSRQGR